MSTTFGVIIPGQFEPVEIVFRSDRIRFTNPLGELLPDNTPVIPLDNSAQGIYFIGDIKAQIKKQDAQEYFNIP